MGALGVIARKDLKAVLTSPMYYMIATCCSVLWAIIFSVKFLGFAQTFVPGQESARNIHSEVFIAHISAVNLIFVVVIPALTMRLLAEEKKMRTFDLLLTAPVTATEIAVGKFLAAFGAILGLVAISFLFPLLTRFMADFPMGPLLTTYLGLVLVSAIYVAIGLFASALTESVVLSVVLGLVFNLMFWFVGMTAERANIPMLASALEYLSVGQHFMAFIGGAIKLNATVFLLSCAGLFLFLTQRVIESARWR